MIPLLTALGLVLGFAALCDHVLNPPETVSAADFVNAHSDNANKVVSSVQAVEKGMLASCDAGIADRASFQQTLSDEQDKFGAVDKSLVSSHPPTGLESAYKEMEKAVVQLNDAVSVASSFVDSQKPSDLKNYSKQWQQGRQQWNEAVTNIWKGAGKRPPTVDENSVPAAVRVCREQGRDGALDGAGRRISRRTRRANRNLTELTRAAVGEIGRVLR